MLKLDSNIELQSFFTWWGEQLRELLPEKVRQHFVNQSGYLVVEPDQKRVTISFVSKGKNLSLGDYEINALAMQDMQTLLQSNQQFRDAECVLRIPAALSLKQDVFVPVAAENNLQQVLGYELDRYTPFNKDQVYYDFVKTHREKNDNKVHVQLVLVKKTILDVFYEKCKTLGLDPSFADSALLTVESLPHQAKYNLLPEDRCKKKDKTPLYVLTLSILFPLVLIFCFLFYPLYKLDNGLDKLRKRSRIVEQEAVVIEDSKRAIDYLYQTTQTVIDKKKAAPSMIDVVDTTSKVLNDNTWVSQLHYSDNTLQLTGQSKSASTLISSLEAAENFRNTKFISPVTKDNRTGLERYRISTEVTTPRRTNAEIE